MGKHSVSASTGSRSGGFFKRARTMGALFTAVSLSGLANCASAADFTLDLPAGEACNFHLRVEATGSSTVSRTFYDKNGNPVRELQAGTGAQLTFTNLQTGSSLALRPNGAVARTVVGAAGINTVTLAGHNVLIMFPTDIPAGPTTTLYVGRVRYTVDTTSNSMFTLLGGSSGTKADICAALSN